MKPKKKRPQVYTRFVFEDAQRHTISNALLFLLSCKDFSFDSENIEEDCADAALDKFFSNSEEVVLTRGELRATSRAISHTVRSLSADSEKYMFLDHDYPDLISDLTGALEILRDFEPKFQLLVRDLRKFH